MILLHFSFDMYVCIYVRAMVSAGTKCSAPPAVSAYHMIGAKDTNTLSSKFG